MTDTDLALIREQLALERSILQDAIVALRCRLEPGNLRRDTAQDRAFVRGCIAGLEEALYCWARIESLLPAAESGQEEGS